MQIRIYRAVEKGDNSGIKPGDWVTTVRDYAKEHGEGSVPGGYKIVSKVVKANEIFTQGDSWLEYGYNPQPYVKRFTPLADIFNKVKANGEEFMPRMKPEGERGFNVDQLNLTEDEAYKFAVNASALGYGDYKIRTWDEAQALADELLTDPATFLKSVSSNGLKDSELLALKSLISTNTKFMAESAEVLKTASPQLADQLKVQVAQASTQIDMAIKKILPASTEIARALNAHKVIAKNSLDPALWYIRAQKELGERVLSVDQKGEIFALCEAKNINGLALYVALLRKPHWAEIASTLYKAGLLTSPSTHLSNLGSNTIRGVMEAVTNDVIGAPIDKLVSLMTGNRSVSYVGLIKRLGYVPTGLGRAWDQLKNGYDAVGKGEQFREIRLGLI